MALKPDNSLYNAVSKLAIVKHQGASDAVIRWDWKALATLFNLRRGLGVWLS